MICLLLNAYDINIGLCCPWLGLVFGSRRGNNQIRSPSLQWRRDR